MSFEEELFDLQMNDLIDISIKEADRIKECFRKTSIDKARVKEVIFKLGTHGFPDRDVHEESIWLLQQLGLGDE